MTIAKFVRRMLGDPTIAWAIGTLGAIAEFSREANESASVSGTSVSTARGGIRLLHLQEAIPLAWERPVADGRWTHGVTLYLPATAAAMHRRTVVTELGPDAQALDPANHEAILFDLGTGAPHCDVCIRTANAELVHRLRANEGRPLFQSGLVARLIETSPDRVFTSRLGRIEVRTPIPSPHGRTPEGPHTHLLPQLLKLGRSHPATLPLPADSHPCVELFPPAAWQDQSHDTRAAFNSHNHARFQTILEQFGDADCLHAKRETVAAVKAGEPPVDRAAYSRKQRLARRVALRQLRQLEQHSPVLDDWIRKFDRHEGNNPVDSTRA